MNGVTAHLAVGGSLPEQVLAAATVTYERAFAAPPYNETAEDAAAFAERTRRYFEKREGARLAWVVAGDDARVAAFALGVIGTRGTWWRDKVAAAVGEDLVGDRCLEVVDVGVNPSWQRHGFGRLVLDLVTAGVPAPVALLGCDPDVPAARGLYESAGFEPVAKGFATDPDGKPHWVMARRLRHF